MSKERSCFLRSRYPVEIRGGAVGMFLVSEIWVVADNS